MTNPTNTYTMTDEEWSAWWANEEAKTRAALADAAMGPVPTNECPDCGGPTRAAFAATDAYRACRRCGHVFPNEV